MKFQMNKIRLSACLSLLLLLGGATFVTSCKENISDDAYAIKTKKTLQDYLVDKPELSSIKAIFDKAKLGLSVNASSVGSVLAARGNYTVFAPNNDAIAAYVSELTKGRSTDYNDLDSLQISAIALNCIIDNGTNSAYELADFPNDGMFATTNLKDRRVSSKDVDGEYIINDVAKVLESNLEASNGMMHVVSSVIVPSDKSIAELLAEAPNMRIITKLLSETGFEDKIALQTTKEEEYEKENLTHAGETRKLTDIVPVTFTYQSKRVIGFTGFVESDDVFAQDWQISTPQVDEDGNITNWSTILQELKTQCEKIYGKEDADDLKSEKNALNQFLAYHFMEGKIVLEDRSAVHHWNEYGYSCGESYTVKSSSIYPTNVWDYYTMMSGALIKITQVADANNIDASVKADADKFFLNRISVYNTDWVDQNQGDYSEKGVKYVNGGSDANGLNVEVSSKNEVDGTVYTNDGANGYYFPINHILVNSTATKEALGSERIRIDFTTMFPEFLSNNLRGNQAAFFPQGYFANISNESSDTKIFYMQEGFNGANFGWKDYQGDEFAISGQYDLVMKLPRVPKTGTYELRLACSNNAERGMVTLYLGTSPTSLVPVGLPIDQRETPDMIPGTPWVADKDVSYDKTTCLENDRNLRNQGYMKGPQYFHQNGKSKDGEPVRNIKGAGTSDAAALRRILKAQTFDADQDYYLRFKLAIPDYANSRLFLDYIEFVPSAVYNGTEPEDIW